MSTKITVSCTVDRPVKEAWQLYTLPEHIVQWNFADPSWHCPQATNELKVGGTYFARMEAKDGSFGFDFEACYTEIEEEHYFKYEFGGRVAQVLFEKNGEKTNVHIDFDAEEENPVEMQRAGWQAILENYKAYCESAG